MTPEYRQKVFDLVAAGIAAGLPVPYRVQIPDDHRIVGLFVGNDNPASVDRWAAWLGLPAPESDGPVESGRRRFAVYRSQTRTHPDLPGWLLQVESYITVAAPVVEVAA
ncbi:hypothetical protein ACFYUR_17430 [Micromonospora haikouensis]|uniref:hypothetical protein n=1 Tax=Micromonospora haikouensis TaxID=686309 RepID=UPI0036986771